MMEDTNTLTHLMQKPRSQSAERPPLLLLLHGLGSNEEDLFSLAPAVDERFLVVSARAPVAMSWGGFCWFNIEFGPAGIIADLEQARRSLGLLPPFIDEVVRTYSVDEKCVYLAGFSQGAMMSLALMLSRPEKIAGVVAMSGRLPEIAASVEVDREALAGMPVLLTHGIYDPVLPVQQGRAARQYLESLPVDLTYREYPMGHEVSMESLRDVCAWLTRSLDAHRPGQGS